MFGGQNMVKEYEVIFKNTKEFVPKLKIVRESSFLEEHLYSEINVGKILGKDYDMSKCVREKGYVVSRFNEFVNGIYQIGLGDSNSCNMPIRNIITFLALIGATEFSLYHNHPGKKAFPSESDKQYVNYLTVIGNLIGCSFSGSYIIAGDQVIKI